MGRGCSRVRSRTAWLQAAYVGLRRGHRQNWISPRVGLDWVWGHRKRVVDGVVNGSLVGCSIQPINQTSLTLGFGGDRQNWIIAIFAFSTRVGPPAAWETCARRSQATETTRVCAVRE